MLKEIYQRQLDQARYMLETTMHSGEVLPKTYRPRTKPEIEIKTPEYSKTDLAMDIAGIADPTGVVDAANAIRYAARGDYVGAGISALGMVPYVGDLAKGARIAKAGATVLKAEKAAASAAKVAAREGEVIGRKLSADEARAAAKRLLTPKPAPSKGLVRTAAETAATAAAAAAGSAVGSSVGSAVGAANPANPANPRNIKPGSDSEKEKQRLDPVPDIGLNIYRLSRGEAGEVSGYSRSQSRQHRGETELPPGYHPFFTGPVNIELNRRRSSYAMSHGIPESTENSSDNLLFGTIKQSVKNYLNSKDALDLNVNMNSIMNTFAK